MSSTYLINQEVAEQRHASEQQRRSSPSRGNSALNALVPKQQNVGLTERRISLAAGALLFSMGLARGGARGLAMLGLGGALAYRGATGYCSAYHALGMNTNDPAE